MNLFDVYPRYEIEPVKGEDVYIYDTEDTRYLDLYGGHAVVSIGHSHPEYVNAMKDQIENLVFYSNSVKVPLQTELAKKLGRVSGYEYYSLFLCSSGAEANENALKLASFYNERSKIVAFKGAFHGRTSAAVAVTDNPKVQAPINKGHEVIFLELGDTEALQETFLNEEISAVIIEGIQGVGGIHSPDITFWKEIQALCERYNTVLIVDEVQSGYGRTGKFFAHQHADIEPDLITVAKGMGNGMPIGGVLISPKFKAEHGLLGTTFGGNHLACVAGITVLDVIKGDNLMDNATEVGNYLMDALRLVDGVKEIRGKGLMIGIDLGFPAAGLRKKLLFESKIFTGASSDKNLVRLLPPLTITKEHADVFLEAFENTLRAYLIELEEEQKNIVEEVEPEIEDGTEEHNEEEGVEEDLPNPESTVQTGIPKGSEEL